MSITQLLAPSPRPGQWFLQTSGMPMLLRPNGTDCEFERRKDLALLLYLRIEHDRRHGRPWLASLLWGESDEGRARGSLSAALTRLQSTLPTGLLTVTRNHVQCSATLACDADWLWQAAQGRYAGPIDIFEHYRQDFLEGFVAWKDESTKYENWVESISSDLRAALRDAWHRAVANAEQHGNVTAVRDLGIVALRIDPFWEHAHRRVLRSLVVLEARHDALELADALERQLAAEGFPPEARTRELIAMVHAGHVAPARVANTTSMPPLRVASARRSTGAALDEPEIIADFDVYLASPMAAVPNTWEQQWEDAMHVVRAFRALPGEPRVFFAGEKLRSGVFEEESDALRLNDRIMRRSGYFLMLYPETVVSSVLVEAGMACALEIPGALFVHEGATLPFMLRQAHQVFPTMLVRPYRTIVDVVDFVEQHGRGVIGRRPSP